MRTILKRLIAAALVAGCVLAATPEASAATVQPTASVQRSDALIQPAQYRRYYRHRHYGRRFYGRPFYGRRYYRPGPRYYGPRYYAPRRYYRYRY